MLKSTKVWRIVALSVNLCVSPQLMTTLSVSPLALSYNIALCHYSLKMYPQALKHIEDIKNRGIKEHPG